MAEQLFEIQADKIVNGTKLMYLNTALTSWTGDLSSLQNGVQMFSGCTNLTSFTGDLSSLTNGWSMFAGTKLTSFNSDLSSLTDGSFMFFGCTNFTSFNSDLSYLTDGYLMFSGCKLDAESLKRIAISLSKTNIPNTTITINIGTDYLSDNGDGSATPTDEGINRDFNLITHKGWTLSFFGDLVYRWDDTDLKYAGCTTVAEIEAKDANYKTTDIVDGVWTEHLPDLETGFHEESDIGLFYNCTALTSFNADLSSLTDGSDMFWACTNLTSFTSNLSSLTNGRSMFLDCTNLESFNSDLSSLTTGTYMFFNCPNLTSFNADLSSLTEGTSMFYDCSELTSFNSDLSSLTNGSCMFFNCTKLVSFNADLSKLTQGECLFYQCSNLESFNADLSSLVNGRYMFFNCTKLVSFNADLSSLVNAYGIFEGCKLDTDSVQNIADTIKDVTSLTNDSSNTGFGYKQIEIGISNSTPNILEEAAFNTMVSKGWTVYVMRNGGSPSQWNPTSLTPIDGEETTTPIPFYAKSVPSDEQHAMYVDADGNYYNIMGGNFIYGDDLSTYGMFLNKEDAAANMRLTKIEK